MTKSIDKFIDKRQIKHGPFKLYAKVDQQLKSAIPPDFRELVPAHITSGLDMIASKMARIITGDFEFDDHWKDIQGYARAVERCLDNFKKEAVSTKDSSTETLTKVMTEVVENFQADTDVNADTDMLLQPTASLSTSPAFAPPKPKPKSASPAFAPPESVPTTCIPVPPLENSLAKPKILTYRNISVEFVNDNDDTFARRQGEFDRKKIKLACDLTQKKVVPSDYKLEEAAKELIANLFNAEHTSIFEHCNVTFLASGLSRSLLAQITRQGTFRFTSASQHFQDYRDYPMTIRPGWSFKKKVKEEYESALTDGLNHYIRLIELGEPPEEARQVLPPAATVNLQITANARNLARFFRQRECNRNVSEMRIFSEKLLAVCLDWLPELFELVGPPCAEDGKCNQGHFSCRRPYPAIGK